LAKTEVCLTLTNKFTVPIANQLDMDRLYIKTKQLITTVFPCTTGDNLIGCLKSRTLAYQEDHYWELIARRQAADRHAQSNSAMIEHVNLFKVPFYKFL
jgi:hypothetical protein